MKKKDAKNRAWSNTRIGRRAGGSVPGLDDIMYPEQGNIHGSFWSHVLPLVRKLGRFHAHEAGNTQHFDFLASGPSPGGTSR